jgi:predicted RNA-binding protein YlxR (DUF448 family)
MAVPRSEPRADRPPVAAAGPGTGPDAGSGADADRSERRCLVTGDTGDKAALIRFVIGPDGGVVPDIGERLPGRGLWLLAKKDILARAVAKGSFSKAARQPVRVAPDLALTVETLLVRQCVALLGLARRSGQATAGFEKVRAWVRGGQAALLIEASDGAADGRRRLTGVEGGLRAGIPVVDVLTAAEMGEAFGRERQVHVALARGRLAERVAREGARLAGFRQGTRPDATD